MRRHTLRLGVKAYALLSLLSVFPMAAHGWGVQFIHAQAPQRDNQPSPSAVLTSNSFEFDPVPEGSEVVHDFIITNRGTAPLNIHRVKTD